MRFVLAILTGLLVTTARADACELVTVWSSGVRTETICRDEAIARGLTVIDLGDNWTPPVLAGDGEQPPPEYNETFRALSQERFDSAGSDGALAKRDRYLELYGISPTLGVVRLRLADEARHRCHDEVDDAALDSADKGAANRAVQQHLACDGLMPSASATGESTSESKRALAQFQRGVMIVPSGAVDGDTRDALRQGSRERDFRTLLRVLRERVVAATGLIEDGTAGEGEGTVLGRSLEPATTWRVSGHVPLPGAAPDLISAATEATAYELGLRDPESARAFLDALTWNESTRLVAVRLPPKPAYYRDGNEIQIEIDRGDVWRHGKPSSTTASRRPALIVYVNTPSARIPLARWPTTIGGWQKQKQADGDVESAWKESPVGDRVWRDIYVGPRWAPPPSTPDRELVHSDGDGYALSRSSFGPSYRSAYGFVAFIHLLDDLVELHDEGIRTHGTMSLSSVAKGVSHGCHRLLGFHAVRLADFLLAHRRHVWHGDTPVNYRRSVHAGGQTFTIQIDTLGYRVELVPPVKVRVLPGTVH